jgi:hypothetical protein
MHFCVLHSTSDLTPGRTVRFGVKVKSYPESLRIKKANILNRPMLYGSAADYFPLETAIMLISWFSSGEKRFIQHSGKTAELAIFVM